MIRYAVTCITIHNNTIIYQSQSHAMWQLNHYSPNPRHFTCNGSCSFAILCRSLANFVQKFDVNAILNLNRYEFNRSHPVVLYQQTTRLSSTIRPPGSMTSGSIVFLPLTSSSRIHLQRHHASYRCARPLPAKAGTIPSHQFCHQSRNFRKN
jgi:hypothetical protein